MPVGVEVNQLTYKLERMGRQPLAIEGRVTFEISYSIWEIWE